MDQICGRRVDGGQAQAAFTVLAAFVLSSLALLLQKDGGHLRMITALLDGSATVLLPADVAGLKTAVGTGTLPPRPQRASCIFLRV